MRRPPFRSALFSRLSIVALSCVAAACGASSSEEKLATPEDEITSNDGAPLELTFSSEVVTRATDIPRKAIAAQLQYVQGILTSDAQANGQAGMPKLTNVREVVEGDKMRITYDAALAVIWPKNKTKPTTYALPLPKDVSALDAFNEKYDGTCGRNEYGQETFWHDFNPKAAGCTIADADVSRATATVRPHPQITAGAYPEYDKIWADDALDVVAVFGIISSNTPEDEGARTREKLLADVASTLRDSARADAPATDGIIKESTVTGSLDLDGRRRRVSLTAFLVAEAAGAGPEFERRYAAATTKADLVIYEGHSGLGKNINALARNTGAQAGKYQLMYLYGCQTLAYLEPAMHEKRIALNGAANDPEGTKFLDVMATALPAYGDDGRSAVALYRAMLDTRAPKTFNALMTGISSLHLVTVFGEHDNTFRP
jgi:hypothetical protein